MLLPRPHALIEMYTWTILQSQLSWIPSFLHLRQSLIPTVIHLSPNPCLMCSKVCHSLVLLSKADFVLIFEDQYTVQSEQYSADLGTYTHTFSPIALEHNFLTPEYSSENQFSDLSIDNIPQWEDSWFPAGAPGELDKAEPLPEHASDDSNHLAVNGALYDAIQIQELKGPSAPFLSPQLTNTPSPPGQHSQNRAMSPKSFPVGATPHSHPKESKTRSRSLRVNSHHTPADSGSSSLQASPSDAFISIIRRVMIGRRQKS